MVKTLLKLARASKTTAAEVAGAGVIVYGVAQLNGPAAWIVAGVAVLAKSMEWDLERDATSDS